MPMRFGIIGTNFISQEFVVAGDLVDGFSVSVVYSRAMETAKTFLEIVSARLRKEIKADCVTSLEELAAREDVDAVYIASPNLFHAPQAEMMLRAGKHVLLEKPACPDRETFAHLCEVAREHGVVLLEAMRPAFIPSFQLIREAIKEIGIIRRASFTYCQYSSRYDSYKRGIVENAFNPALCNGSLMDIGVYCVHALVSLFGLPEQMEAAAQKLDNGLDAQGSILCLYRNMMADLSWSKVANHHRFNEIQGEMGTLLIDSISNPTHIELVGWDREVQVLHHDPDADFFSMHHEIAAFMAFAAAPAGERPWEIHNRVTEDSLALMDEIRKETRIDFRVHNQ